LPLTGQGVNSDVNYPALKGGASCFILPLLRQVHRLDGAFRTCYPNKILILQGEFLDIDCRVDIAIMAGAAVGALPLSIREYQVPLYISTATTEF